MKGIRIDEHGGPERLVVRELADPVAGAGLVLVEVKACGVNHLDVWVRRGIAGVPYPLPLVLGSDVAGVVRAVGDGVHHVAPGAEVVVAPGVSCGHCQACLSGRDERCRKYGILGEHRDGGYAELIAVPAANVVPKPARLSFEQAAALGVAFLTAWHMLVARAAVAPGELVLVQAAGSGVGSAALQIAKLWGATVIAVARGQGKLARAKELGADHTLDSEKDDVGKAVKQLSGGKGCGSATRRIRTTAISR